MKIEIKEKATNEMISTSENTYSKGRGLRKLLNKRAKEKLELLRKYFYKFQKAGILLALRKGTKRASLFKKMEGINLEDAFNTVAKSKTLNDIEVNEFSQVNDFKDSINKKLEDEKFAKEMEIIAIEKEKKRQEEEERLNELKKKRNNALQKLLYKADRRNKLVLKLKFEIYFLKAKVMSLNQYNYSKPKRIKTIKKKGKSKRRSVQIERKDISENNLIRSISVEDDKMYKSEDEKEAINNKTIDEDNEDLKIDE